MKKVTKAVIPAAGLGTRVLPATKAMPKGMLPIVDKPAILYLVEEAVRSGITDILIILGRNQSIIEDHFDRSPELEEKLAKPGKEKMLEELTKEELTEFARFGNAVASLCVENKGAIPAMPTMEQVEKRLAHK